MLLPEFGGFLGQIATNGGFHAMSASLLTPEVRMGP
jgi:hypothetical protein